jgi:O-6-methylguanine DNA methyltransferase
LAGADGGSSGEIQTYAGLAQKIGRPTATPVVVRANRANQSSILIPSHRVIGADGNLTVYNGGLWRKRSLIDLELQYK